MDGIDPIPGSDPVDPEPGSVEQGAPVPPPTGSVPPGEPEPPDDLGGSGDDWVPV